MSKQASIIAITLAVLVLPALAIIEKKQPSLWNDRLLWPHLTPETPFHTPIYVKGTFLPPTLAGSRTLTAADNPVILAQDVLVPAGVTLTIEPGTHLYAHEFSTLDVSGTLQVIGTAERPVLFSTNEQNELNQTWNGIFLRGSSNANVTHSSIRHASPAISCLAGSEASIRDTTVLFGSMEIYTETDACPEHI